MHITLLLSQFLHRAVKFTSKLFGRALSRRIKATVLYATETGRSEQYAKQLVELLGHAFNAQVSEHRSMVPRLWIYPFFRAGCWFWEKVFTDGALLGVDLRGNNVVRGWDWTTYVWRWMSVLLRYHSITCRCAFTAPRDGRIRPRFGTKTTFRTWPATHHTSRRGKVKICKSNLVNPK